MEIKIATVSDQGGRTTNDDTVRFRHEGDSACIFVGDGLGSYRGGSLASQAAAEAVLKASRQGSLLTEEQMTAMARQAEQAVRAVQKDQMGNMKTTLVTLAIEDGRARWMHVGDSRLYYFHGGKIHTMTKDHSVSQMAVLMGEITPRQIRFHEDRNRVLRALGGENARPELSQITMLTEGQDAFLLCTDGFWEYVYEEEMEELLQASQTPQDWLEAMEQLLRTRVEGNNDNFTAAAVFCE